MPLIFFSGHLHLKGSTEKMSKSLKNYITIKVKTAKSIHLNELCYLVLKVIVFFCQDFLKSYSPNEFRMFCLLTKYRSGGTIKKWLFLYTVYECSSHFTNV